MGDDLKKKGFLATAFMLVVLPFGTEFVSELAFTFTDWGSDILQSAANFLGLEGGIHGTPVDQSLLADAGGEHAGEILSSKDPEGWAECYANGGETHDHGNASACTPS